MTTRMAPIRDPLQDAVLNALSHILDQPLGLPQGCNEQRLNFEDAPYDVRLVFMRVSGAPWDEVPTDTAITITFSGLNSVIYQRTDGMATIRIADGMLPETLALSLCGRRVDEVIDMPGVGHWTIEESRHSDTEGGTILTIAAKNGRTET